MLNIDLASLNAQQLTRLLEDSRARGQVELEAQIRAELQARRTRRSDWPAEPGRMSLNEFETEHFETEDFETEAGDPEPRRRGLAGLGVAAVLVILAGAAFWWWSTRPSEALAPVPAVAPAPAAAAPDAPAPVADAVTPQATPQPEAAPVPAPVQPAVAVARPASACAGPMTRADRLVCNSPRLTARHRAMRQAYRQALDAGADAVTIELDQSEWRAARARAPNRKVLEALYDHRIRVLNAATAAIRAEDPPN